MQISRTKFAAFAEALWSLRVPGESSPRQAAVLAAALRSLFPGAAVAIAPVRKLRRIRASRYLTSLDFTLRLAAGRQEIRVRLPEGASPSDRFLLRELMVCSAAGHSRTAEDRVSASASQADLQPRLPRLTPREIEVLRWLAVGKRDGEIAIIIGAARRTVNKHVENILRKLKVETRGAAARLAADHRLEDTLEPAKPWP